MAGSSQLQANFLGGEWSDTAQGRSDLPEYATALRRSLNGLPSEEGWWTRRTGTMRLGPTHLRQSAVLRPFQSSSGCAFGLEFTNAALRAWSGANLIFNNDTAMTISAASYTGIALSITLAAPPDGSWVAGQHVMLVFPAAYDPSLEGGCRGRVFQITGVSGAVVTLKDDVAANLTLPAFITGSLLGGVKVIRVLRIVTTYTSALDDVRVVQSGADNTEGEAVILKKGAAPQLLTVVEPVTGAGNDPVFTLAGLTFTDGPYLDPQGTVTTPEGGTVSGTSGSITFTPTSSAFSATDVGRLIRFFTQPPAYNPATSYAAGTQVTFNGQYWQAINTGPYASSNVGIYPGALFYATSGNSAAFWIPAVQAGKWGWGTITAQAGASCTVNLTEPLSSTNGTTVTTWALGVYKSGQYPTCGIWHEGRLFLGGAVANRFDASMSNALKNGAITFSPSDFYNNVFDNHAISYILNAKDSNAIKWFEIDKEGILAGTETSEWLISASENNDILTPTSVQSRATTRYGSHVAEPRRVGISVLFIHRYGRRLVEYLADAFSGKYTGRHINERAKHLTQAGLAEIVSQEENQPVIWGRTNTGGWIGCTYRRLSRFVTDAPVFNGWHQHKHGAALSTLTSLCVVPAEDGLSDRLYMALKESSGDSFVEMMRPLADPGNNAA